MKVISSWDHLRAFGIDALTGEACGLGFRILCDVTAKGKKVLEKCLGTPSLTLYESWNRGSQADPHVGCVMLVPELLMPLSVFALLESGYKEVWVCPRGFVYAIDPDDPDDSIETVKRWLEVKALRRFSYRGTAGDRNIHQMSGRVN